MASAAPTPSGTHPEARADARADVRLWHDIVRETLKANDVRLVTYVPDNVLKGLIASVHADPFFTAFACTREEEALGIVAGAWMGGMRGILLMQTSGFATLANVLASLPVAFQIPTLMMISERGTLGEFNIGQALVCRTMRPVLTSLAVEHHTLTRLDELEFTVDRSIKQAMATRAPVALILSPLLTGGKVFKA
ncbi:MAG: decarboxylase [Rhizobiales bacterium]|nr:decarboxylase [Hyphomicrobiales bacterium]